MDLQLPDQGERLRCAHCGNLTRFDVQRSRATREYWHFSLAGVPTVEEEQVISESVVTIVCRWCGSADGIEVVPRPGPEDEPGDTDTGPGGTP